MTTRLLLDSRHTVKTHGVAHGDVASPLEVGLARRVKREPAEATVRRVVHEAVKAAGVTRNHPADRTNGGS